MPVPVSVTHAKKAVGLDAAQHTELPSAGPFARAAEFNQKIAEENAPKEESNASPVVASDQQPTTAAKDATPPPSAPAALATHNLNFWYTDIGKQNLTSLNKKKANCIQLNQASPPDALLTQLFFPFIFFWPFSSPQMAVHYQIVRQ